MPDIALPSFQGEEVKISQFKGKNVMLIFPRGYAMEGMWCPNCIYRHAQLVEYEKNNKIRDRYNLEIIYVLPYSKELIQDFLNSFPATLALINDWKNPPGYEEMDEDGKAFIDHIREIAPEDLTMDEGEETPTPFPILIDEDSEYSKALGIFRTEWSGSKVDQNIPSVYIVDKDGILQFKNIAQHTFDRPSLDYLVKMLSYICGEE
ncbi:MAG: peroxiredoxin family protein [candidate division Zixibacteria bacterium]|nr:peroxiredoxin family protein [candidate division Zixibacteria bacterium]